MRDRPPKAAQLGRHLPHRGNRLLPRAAWAESPRNRSYLYRCQAQLRPQSARAARPESRQARCRGRQKGGRPKTKGFPEFTGQDGKAKRLPIEQTMVDRKTQKPIGMLKWHFTGSVSKQPDPEKNDKVYGSDVTGTLMTLLPVTDEAVIQSNLKAEDEPAFKLETNKCVLPREGSPAKLVIEAK